MSDVPYLVLELASFVSSSTTFWPTKYSPVIYFVQFKAEPARWICTKNLYDVADCMLRPVLKITSFKYQTYFDTRWTNMVVERCVNFSSKIKRHCSPDNFFKFILPVWIFPMCAAFQTYPHIIVRRRQIEWTNRSTFPLLFCFLRESKRPFYWYLLFLSAVSYMVARKIMIGKVASCVRHTWNLPHIQGFLFEAFIREMKEFLCLLLGKSNLFLNTFLLLSCLGFESWWGRDFPHPSRPDPRPIQRSVKLVPHLFLGVNWWGRGAYHPIPPIV